MTALVTGGSGFLGRHIADALHAAGHEVRLLDVVAPGEELPDGQVFVQADVRDDAALQRAAEGCDVVVGNAALVPVTRSSAQEFRSVNVDGCAATIRAARAAGAYLVHVSSSSVYGRPRRFPVTEDTPLAPFEPYGASKAEADRVVAVERSADFPIAGLRSRALLGRGRLGLFELVFSQIRAGRRVPVFGRGANVLQMTAASDFAAAVLACVERRADGDFNIAAADFGTVRGDLEALIERVGSTSRLLPVPIPLIRAVLQPLDAVGRSPFTAWHWEASGATFYASIEKARRELGWIPERSNVDALEDAYREYLAGRGGGTAHSSPLPGVLARLLRAS